jgi:hypothetical protein
MVHIARLCESDVCHVQSITQPTRVSLVRRSAKNQVSAVEAQNKAVFGTTVVPRNHSSRFRPREMGQVSEQTIAAKPDFSGFFAKRHPTCDFLSLLGGHSRISGHNNPADTSPKNAPRPCVLPQTANSSTEDCARY